MSSVPLWLERSREFPIAIVVNLMEPLVGDDHDVCLSILLQLREHLHRSHSLNVSILYEVYFKQLFPEKLETSLPILEKMQIHLDHEWWTIGRAFLRQFNVPSIRLLRLHGNAAEQETRRWAIRIRIALRMVAMNYNLGIEGAQEFHDTIKLLEAYDPSVTLQEFQVCFL
jgi:hypothetical protein